MQGNAAANAAFEQVATGCLKPIGPVPNPENAPALLTSLLNPTNLLSTLLTNPQNLILVPGDPKRQFVSKKQYKDIFKAGSQADGHGFDYIDPAQEAASKGAAGYYSWSPTPGMRFIALDTVAEAGTIVTPTGNFTADGNIDDPSSNGCEASWKRRPRPTSWWCSSATTRRRASPPTPPTSWRRPACSTTRTGTTSTPAATSTRATRSRSTSRPTSVDLLHEFPNAIAWVAGHSHDNVVNPFPNPSGPGGFWSIRVAAEADWPQQSRLLEVFDNHDGTLSIFGTILDHVGQSAAPAPGTPAARHGPQRPRLGGRTMCFNDLQSGAPLGEGQAEDRNVELLVADPR